MKIGNRKLFGMVFGVLVIVALWVITVIFAPTSTGPTALVFAITSAVFLVSAFIGGNVFSAWIKSTHFNKDLVGEDEKE